MQTCRVLYRLSLASVGVIDLAAELLAQAFRLLDAVPKSARS